mgnify:CR=1 FL=1
MPGARSVTRAPVSIRSQRRLWKNCFTKTVLASQTCPHEQGYCPATRSKLMMLAPSPISIRCGSSAWVTLTMPSALVSILECQSSRATFCAGAGASARPALLMSTATGLKLLGNALTTP